QKRRKSKTLSTTLQKRPSDTALDTDRKPKWAPPPLSKSLSESVARLAAPKGRGSIGESRVGAALAAEGRGKSKIEPGTQREESQEDGEGGGDVHVEEQVEGRRKRGSKDSDEGFEIDMAVWGNSIRGFWKPREVAMRAIGPEVVVPPRWRYPVPNPVPWK
ncbi:hypothetical protein HK097_005169, partial [Rhizophlyctis rosea]